MKIHVEINLTFPAWFLFLAVLVLFILGEIVFSWFGLISYTTAEFQHGVETFFFFLAVFLILELMIKLGYYRPGI